MKSNSFLFISMIILAGCTYRSEVRPYTQEHDVSDTQSSPTMLPVEVQRIFSSRCAAAYCHAQPEPGAALVLTRKYAYGALVNQPSALQPERLRVKPFEPGASMLIDRLTGIVEPSMPFAAPPLETEQLKTIIDWIAAGAEPEQELTITIEGEGDVQE